jgi:hypothetical protein
MEMFNRSSLMKAATRAVVFLQPVKWLAKRSIVLFYQTRMEVIFAMGRWWELSMQFKK